MRVREKFSIREGAPLPAIRQLLKSGGEQLLCRVGAAAWARRRRATDVVILAYHNIVPEGEAATGDTSLHLTQRAFARQLDLLGRTHDVVPLSAEVLTPGRTGRPRAVITFDDACAGAVTAGVAELARRGMPATIFVPPAFLGGGSFWWDVVAAGNGAAPSAAGRHHALTELQGRDALVRAWAVSHGLALREVAWHQRVASEGELRATAEHGVRIGAHSWSHPNLAALPLEEARDEVVRPLHWLRDRFTHAVAWLAYPYGITSVAVKELVRAAGYEGALCISGGWIREPGRGLDRFALPRQNIPAGLSLRGFELRTAGLLAGRELA